MRSAEQANTGRVHDDLTTKARIRDTAILMIGRSGFAAATVRAIAAEVGVSAALLLHHFGSKDGLRQACDDHVLGWFATKVAEIAADDSPATLIGMIDDTPEMLPFAAYIRQSLTDGGQFARRIFDALVADMQRYVEHSVASGRLRPSQDEHGRALLMVVTKFGTQLLAHYVAPPGTPADQLLQVASDRLLLPGLELYTYGMFTDTGYLDAYREYAAGQSAGHHLTNPERPEPQR